eukprot:TRINITY_DN11289_c0_g1_i1.p1 TRINITY_DN11289_c0_g1~~TRINITY_DN11289_c0_g1_i1.p1  ORF type:complete len:207 (-),score=45.39 TRINITY_DN11289_c0_g1_i1:159-779(-)
MGCTPSTEASTEKKKVSPTNLGKEEDPKTKAGYDYLFKIMLVGDAGVGKSCILNRYTNNTFNPEYSSTIGLDFSHRTFTHNDKIVRLQIWDTAGQERFRTITSSYYRGSHGILLVYDVTEKRTFEHLEYWKEQIEEFSNTYVKVMMVGNKCCSPVGREVEFNKAKEKADAWQYGFMETSAKTGKGVEEAFKALVDEIIKVQSEILK